MYFAQCRKTNNSKKVKAYNIGVMLLLLKEVSRLRSALWHVKDTLDLWQCEGDFWPPGEVELFDQVNRSLEESKMVFLGGRRVR